MISVECRKCGHELNKQGAILFSPPQTLFLGSYGKVDKYHLCVDCYEIILQIIEENK